jgi:HEAT repeat protein
MLQALLNLAEGFASTPMIASREMRRLLDSNREEFTRAALALVKGSDYSAGHQYALTLLVTNNLIIDKLADPRATEVGEAVEIARRIQSTVDSFLDIKLIRLLLPNNHTPAAVTEPAALLRVLEIIGAISDGSRIMTLLTQLLGHPDGRVRSKVALLVGRINHNLKWVEQRLSEPDARVRANAVESLWGLDSPEACQIFQQAIGDVDNRVAGNGALGLYRCGDPGAAEALWKMLAHDDARFRATAAWAMGETADPRFLPQLTLRIAESDVCVKQNVFRAIQKIRKRVKLAQDAGSLRVLVTRQERLGTARRLTLAVLKPPAQVHKINPADVVVTDGGAVVTRVTIRTRQEADHRVAGFVLPRLISREDPIGQATFESLRLFLRYKRKLDAWTATKYASFSAPGAQPATFRLESALLSSGSGSARASAAVAVEEQSRDVDPIRFSTDPRAILQIAESAGMRASAADSAEDAVRRLIDAMSVIRGHRFLFLFISQEIGDAGWDDLRARAREARVAVSALLYRREPPAGLSRLCAESGGAAASGDSAEEMIAASERLAATLASFHTLEYEPPNSSPGPVKVQVYSELGYGEDVIGA